MINKLDSSKKIKILAYVHGYFPNHNAGSEAMLHQILVDLRSRGHEVRVLTHNPGAESYEQVEIKKIGDPLENEWLAWSDIIFTHLDETKGALSKARRSRRAKPIVIIVHNNFNLYYNHRNIIGSANLLIANSEWLLAMVKKRAPTVLVYPPTIPDRYRVQPSGDAITMINMNENKGGKIFWQLARIFPDKKFIGVRGAYGEQIMYNDGLPNVTVIENTVDIQSVYEQSRIVIMPSSYESWGRVAMEAACSGIPVIASPTPGLKESLDYSGIFAEHDNVADWVEAIRFLDNEQNYKKYSELAQKRSAEVADKFKDQMKALEEKLLDILQFAP